MSETCELCKRQKVSVGSECTTDGCPQHFEGIEDNELTDTGFDLLFPGERERKKNEADFLQSIWDTIPMNLQN